MTALSIHEWKRAPYLQQTAELTARIMADRKAAMGPLPPEFDPTLFSGLVMIGRAALLIASYEYEIGEYPTIQGIVETVAERRRLSIDALLFGPRELKFVRPRHEAMWLARRMTNLPLKTIGAAIGGRDHATVVNGTMRFHALIDAGEIEI